MPTSIIYLQQALQMRVFNKWASFLQKIKNFLHLILNLP
jgi:hypothetical protein